MMKSIKLMMLAIMSMAMVACGGIETGNVGVRTANFTQTVDMTEVPQGFYTSFISSVDQFSAREITVSLENMQPKARDNLSLSDLDIEIYYNVVPDKIAEVYVQYSGKSAYDSDVGVWYPAYTLVKSLGRSAAYTAASEFDSLELHKNRDALGSRIKEILVSSLSQRSVGVFEVTGVVVRNAKTDPSIEDAIKLAVTKQKELEAAETQVKVNTQLSLANNALQSSLSPSILRMRELDVMEKAITNGSQPFVMFGGGATPLINVPSK